jgi:hypothetical protein
MKLKKDESRVPGILDSNAQLKPVDLDVTTGLTGLLAAGDWHAQ